MGAALRVRRQRQEPQASRPAPPFRAVGVRGLDRGIRRAVRVLWGNGVETYESCEGGRGHPFPDPTVRFHGRQDEGFRALAVALRHGLKVTALRRFYDIVDGEPQGPYWEMTFRR